MLPREGGFAIMLQDTGIPTQTQEMHVAAALRDKGYIPFFSSRLVATGSTPQGGCLLTTVSCKYVAEHKVVRFTQIVPGKAAALEIRTDKGGLTLINIHHLQASSSPLAGQAAFWDDIQMYAAAYGLGGRHPVVVAGDTNIYMDAITNRAAEHFRSGWEACCFSRGAAGATEDMIPTLQLPQHRMDTFLGNEPLLPWSLQESVLAGRMARRRFLDPKTFRSSWSCQASSTRREGGRYPPPTATARASSSRTTLMRRPSNAACGQQ